MIGLRDGLRNGQADAVFAVLSFIKSIEHVGQILLRDAGAIVCHPDDCAFSAAMAAETDLFARVTNHVGNEISEQTLSVLLPDRQHNRVFIKIEGKGQLLVCGNTLQLMDYAKTDWPWTMFDPVAKQQRHETVFQEERKKAFRLGMALAE